MRRSWPLSCEKECGPSDRTGPADEQSAGGRLLCRLGRRQTMAGRGDVQLREIGAAEGAAGDERDRQADLHVDLAAGL